MQCFVMQMMKCSKLAHVCYAKPPIFFFFFFFVR